MWALIKGKDVLLGTYKRMKRYQQGWFLERMGWRLEKVEIIPLKSRRRGKDS